MKMKTNVASFLVGFIFAIGLGLAGMTQPHKILAFLDMYGNWDASLLFVMAGAIGVHFFTYRFIRRRDSPLFSTEWHVPTKKDITPQLVVGAILFGIGWGIGGFCPGPAITALGGLSLKPVVFLVSLVLGMYLYSAIEKKLPWPK